MIVFLVWSWITDIAVLLGAEFNAETRRERASGPVCRAPGRFASS